VATAGAGYVAPGMTAIAGAALIAHGATRVWLTVLLVLGTVMVIGWVRNLFGVAVVGTLVLCLGWLLVSGTSGETLLAGSIVTWYLAFGGLRATVEQLRVRDRGDAFELGRLLRLPAGLVGAGFVVVSAASVVACVALMFHW
jgi:Peptidase M50B-like